MMTLLNGLQLVAASQPECFNNGPVHAGFVVAEADTATDGHGIGRNVVSIGGSVCIGVDKLSGAKETADECDEMNRSFGHLIFLSLWNHSSWLMDLNCLSILKKSWLVSSIDCDWTDQREYKCLRIFINNSNTR